MLQRLDCSRAAAAKGEEHERPVGRVELPDGARVAAAGADVHAGMLHEVQRVEAAAALQRLRRRVAVGC